MSRALKERSPKTWTRRKLSRVNVMGRLMVNELQTLWIASYDLGLGAMGGDATTKALESA